MSDEHDLNAVFAEFYRERARLGRRGIFRTVPEVTVGFWLAMLIVAVELVVGLQNLRAGHPFEAAILIACAGLVLVTNVRMARSFHRFRRAWCALYRHQQNKQET